MSYHLKVLAVGFEKIQEIVPHQEAKDEKATIITMVELNSWTVPSNTGLIMSLRHIFL